MFEPPSRSSAWRFGYSTPRNFDDMLLDCGGFENQWQHNGGRCGTCGDPYQGPRENEAGGKYATGLIMRNYTEGQLIDIHLEIRVAHGGWSELRICPNNDVHTPATQACLDEHLLALENGTTRIAHSPTVPGLFKYKLRLPKGLTCTQCVLQWRWTTNTLNNCMPNGSYCCNGCGPQGQFYGCADVAIEPATPTRTMLVPTTSTTMGHTIEHNTDGVTGGFIPIDAGVSNVSPPAMPCVATISGQLVFGPDAADTECQQRCRQQSSLCPILLCANSCFI